jgi:hypothetical protein
MNALLSITIGLCILSILWAIHQWGKTQEKKKEIKVDDHMIQSLINARWDIQAQIRECKSMAELSELYWDIERLGMDYEGLVNDDLLRVHVEELFSYHARVAQEIRQVLFS